MSSHPSSPMARAGAGLWPCGLPGTRRAASIVPAWPCTGWGLPGRRVTAPPVRSYRTISPLPATGSRVARRLGGVFLWHFPAGFPGSALPTTLPFGVRTFLEGRFSLRPPRLLGQQLNGTLAGRAGRPCGSGRAPRRTAVRWPGRRGALRRGCTAAPAHRVHSATLPPRGGVQALPTPSRLLLEREPVARAGARARDERSRRGRRATAVS